MSWLAKLKQSLSGGASPDAPPRTESYPLNLYGKLPIYKDFISSGLTDEAAKEFRDWIGNGFSRRWATRDDYRGCVVPSHGFLLPLPGAKRLVAGALWGSHDEGGLRQFPFSLFALLPPGKPISEPLVALSHLHVFEERAAFISRNFQAGRTIASFYEAFRGARVDLPLRQPAKIQKELAEYAGEVTTGEFASAVLGKGARVQWPRFVKTLTEHVAGVGKGGPDAIRIPLGGVFSPEVQLQFWITWLRNHSLLDGAPLKGLLFERAEGRARAVLFFRDLRPDDFLLLHPVGTDYDYVEELGPSPSALRAAEQGDDAAAEDPAAETAPAGWEEPLAGILEEV